MHEDYPRDHIFAGLMGSSHFRVVGAQTNNDAKGVKAWCSQEAGPVDLEHDKGFHLIPLKERKRIGFIVKIVILVLCEGGEKLCLYYSNFLIIVLLLYLYLH